MSVDQERWRTPPEVFDPLFREFNFDLDGAADCVTAQLDRYISPTTKEDALTMIDWPGERIWLNPPYGNKLEPFVRKADHEASKGKLIVALIPFRCRAAWWHECVVGRAAEVRCVRKRIKFIRPDGTHGKWTGSCDSCLVLWNGPVEKTIITSWKWEDRNA